MAMLDDLDAAARVVYAAMTATPQQRWPLLDARCGAAVWVKHENQTPVGAFKMRGGLVYFDHLRAPPARRAASSRPRAATTASRSASRRAAWHSRRGRRPARQHAGKNAAMRALGVELIEEGHDFQAALEAAGGSPRERGWHMVPSFDALLVQGVASYALELLRAVPDLDALYVPIGLGSGSAARSPRATRSALDTDRRRRVRVRSGVRAIAGLGAPVSHEATTRIADGMACRTPVPEALETIRARCRPRRRSHRRRDRGCDARDLRRHAQRGRRGRRAALAALLQGSRSAARPHVAIVVSGGNIDSAPFSRILAGERSSDPGDPGSAAAGRDVAVSRAHFVSGATDIYPDRVVFPVARARRRVAQNVLVVQFLRDSRRRRPQIGRVVHDLGAASALVGDFRQRFRIDAGVDRLPACESIAIA